MTSETKTGAKQIINALVEQDVQHVFGYPGGAVLPIYDELFQQNHIQHFLVRHEQGAVHAAEGYARSTGKVGVVIVTSGPGVTNAVTGLTDAMMDSVPIVCISGQVPTHLIGTDAFQECDATGITRPCTKHNYLVKDPAKVGETIHEAFHIARSGRPGPVLVDVPKDIQFAHAPYIRREQVSVCAIYSLQEPDPLLIERAADLLVRAKRPIIYAGGGIINSGQGATDALRELIDLTDFPFVLTLMGLGAAPASHERFLGMLGMHGSYEANHAMHDCDVMLAVGARFDDRITGRIDAFSPGSKKIHLDVDSSSIHKITRADVPIICDAKAGLQALVAAVKARKTRPNIKPWLEQAETWRAVRCFDYEPSKEIIKPQYALERLEILTKASGKDIFITTEVGQHQMWAAQFLKFEEPRRWMTSGGLGTMGYGLPAAVGVQVAHPNGLVIDVAGEASIMMVIQEFATAIQYRLPIKVFILNNRYLGMVRQWQELLHGSRYSESYSDALPDFVRLAEAFHGKGLRIEKPSEVDEKIQEMIDHPGPVLVDVVVDPKENCFPMIPSGKAHNEMILASDFREKTSINAVTDEGKRLV